jgi:hypothetical protein
LEIQIFRHSFLYIESFQKILRNILKFTCVYIQDCKTRGQLQSSSRFNSWQFLGPPHAQLILSPLVNLQIMWYFSTSQSTSIHVNQIKVESRNNVFHIKSPFWCTIYIYSLKKFQKIPKKIIVTAACPNQQKAVLAYIVL